MDNGIKIEGIDMEAIVLFNLNKMAIDYVKIGIILSRTCLAITLLIIGIDTFGDAGDRVYNKYMHSLRKMYLP